MHQWNAAIDYIEAKLTEDISGAELAKVALTSEYHFRRMFATLAGIPLSEYIRNRRITQATAQLLAGASVLDTAVAYGYGSADAFSRAFKSFHGITPTQARAPGSTLRSQSPLKIHLRIEGKTNVSYRIVTKPAFQLVGFNTQVPIVQLGENDVISAFERNLSRRDIQALAELANVEPHGSLSATEYLEHDDTQVIYWRGVATTAVAPAGIEGLKIRQIPAGQWVVLSAEGKVPEAFQELWATAATEWFPANPYEWAPGPQLLDAQLYEDKKTGRADLWIPITAKSALD